MAPSGKLRRSENLPDEGLVWAVPCKECDAGTANSFKLGAVTKGSQLTFATAANRGSDVIGVLGS